MTDRREWQWSARRTIPVACIAAFFALYAAAAERYPGGTRADPTGVGFSALHNYWCDLLDVTSYGGQENPARPVALSGMLVLSVGLAFLWWSAPSLYPKAPCRALAARCSGLASAVLIPFVATRFHDLVVNFAGLLGLIAFLSTMTAIGMRRWRSLSVLSALALVLTLGTFLIWRTGIFLDALALIQKAAFAAFLGWAMLLAGYLPTRSASDRA